MGSLPENIPFDALTLVVIATVIGGFLVVAATKLFRRLDETRLRLFSEETRRSQRELDEYLNRNHSSAEIGRIYERQIGYHYEKQGYHVEYHGLHEGIADRGRDLILRKKSEVVIVQAKCWARGKYIPLNQIYQLYGATKDFELEKLAPGIEATPRFISTCPYVSEARASANRLKVELIQLPLDQSYPMVKCNNSLSGQKIYHLPTDPFYDKIQIDFSAGDSYVHTAAEAAQRGFRRAKTYRSAS